MKMKGIRKTKFDQLGNRGRTSGPINDAEDDDGLGNASGQDSNVISKTIKDALKIVDFGSSSYKHGGTKKGLKTGHRGRTSGPINDAEDVDGLGNASGQDSNVISKTIKDALKIVDFGSSYKHGGTKKGLKTGTYLK
ncbi:unnamed protein product [Mucor hiemalis]